MALDDKGPRKGDDARNDEITNRHSTAEARALSGMPFVFTPAALRAKRTVIDSAGGGGGEHREGKAFPRVERIVARRDRSVIMPRGTGQWAEEV